ncbi:MAG: shikimate kinase [Ancrocorticia populi]|uniref:Shikimate kinase n=1 Tax=Ancrocorticia populi TaxID=2175228 RepID=A0A2V1K523_9ACTO|nr:shikimate kinase [Ancrocorticia populi]MDN6487171.1 shikimate kinase [Ancrocorticia sp.]PWF26404.1 shikimate kinase [Ancrocorticia populi]
MSVKAVFVGMPGSGKSTVGRNVARQLGTEFRDSDALIEETTGRTIPQIFEDGGESGFRDIEAAVIQEALDGYDGVLSLGGGAVLTESTRAALKGHPVFLIDVAPEELLRRVTKSRTVRPLLVDDPELRLRELREQREHLYREVARHTVSSDETPVAGVVAAVLEVLA